MSVRSVRGSRGVGDPGREFPTLALDRATVCRLLSVGLVNQPALLSLVQAGCVSANVSELHVKVGGRIRKPETFVLRLSPVSVVTR